MRHCANRYFFAPKSLSILFYALICLPLETLIPLMIKFTLKIANH